MKILHTSDWHFGHSLYSYNREDEYRDFISQLSEIIHREMPDAVLISGDIFDSALPSLSARRLWTDALILIKNAHPNVIIVATAGNHDSGSNLDVTSPLLKDDFHIIGRKHSFVRIEDSSGLGMMICAVPFISENGYRSRLPEELKTVDDPRRTYYEWVLAEGAKQSRKDDVIVLMAHEAISNSTFNGQEKYNFNFSELDVLGKGYNYLALGHIHCPQILARTECSLAAYSGSPIPMGFDEDFEHSVSIVEFSNKYAAPSIRNLQINQMRPLLTLPEAPIQESEAIDYAKKLISSNVTGYLRLNVCSNRPLPSLHTRLQNIFSETDLRFCLLKYNQDGDKTLNAKQVPTLSIQDLQTVDPMTLALNYYQRKTGTEMDEDMRKCLLDIINESE